MQSVRVKGHVSGSYASLLFDWLGASFPDLVQDMPFERPVAGELNRIPVSQLQQMLEWVNAQVDLPDFPLPVAEFVKPSNTGLLGYIASCCNTLGEAFARLQQFENLVYSVNAMQVVLDEKVVTLRWGEEQGRPGHLVDSLAIGVLLAFSRSLLDQPLNPLRVQFINARPEWGLQRFEAFFGCSVYFECKWTEVSFSAEVLQLPLRAPDAVMRKILDEQAALLLRQVDQREEKIPGLNVAMQEVLTAGSDRLEDVAKRMGFSPRTLQRKLQQAGLGFRCELNSLRTEMAKNLLSQGELSLPDIASLLVYNDQSAFTHAFKRSVGETPARFRKKGREISL